MESNKYQLNSTDLKKVGKGALIALGGALVTYLAQAIGQIDFGTWTPVVMALSSIVINFVQKLLAGPSVTQ